MWVCAAIFITIVILRFEIGYSRIIWSQCMCGCVLMQFSTDLRWVYLCWPAGRWVKNGMSWGNTQPYAINHYIFYLRENFWNTYFLKCNKQAYYRCTDSFLTSLRAQCSSQLDSLAQPGCVKGSVAPDSQQDLCPLSGCEHTHANNPVER